MAFLETFSKVIQNQLWNLFCHYFSFMVKLFNCSFEKWNSHYVHIVMKEMGIESSTISKKGNSRQLPSAVLISTQFPISVPGKFSKPIKLTMTKSATNHIIFINRLGFLKIDSRTFISSKFRAFGRKKCEKRPAQGLCEWIIYKVTILSDICYI